ncbi:tripartite tricarboxylate transporter substrate binding protein [Rhodoplanes sp. TEM]|uniref:Tripartite tricarboxylate transporter substrate binding protein n=1 Tax=Rhodoplanes tepidamans TaxID=200616 RepID=A0ABT5JCT8_RHOTP|nr:MULTISPECIES: tripartite tricarboxylate transporter substrate binding protein [Rhodoplanes]MDC7787439.1 tripartite tricarboxylate transporter substrate binding protein [Rhodoplanes tepidamans]MDC7986348.1 tripartite tricarboxylate transporter substrate binding protein [Rhodoplanes sp. TEM]MDQ0358075.1 tripartite-type tricarboxylate transporter receptor subunit TctC [Rhodoplanes tepidamans]
MTTRRALLKSLAAGALAAGAGAAGLPRGARAAGWPDRPVRILVPFAAGGNTDGIARLLAAHLSEKLGQQFIVENRTGAGGTIAAESTARSTPDGYTLMVAAVAQMAVFPAIKKTNYDPLADFAPISNVASNPFCLVVNPGFPAKTLPELVAHVKANPGKLVYASGGNGSISHLTMAMFVRRAGLEMMHTPYRGGAPAVADVIAGHVPMYFGNLSEALPHAGRALRPLAVSGATRAAKLPNVPTVAEQGYPGFKTDTWNGLLAPAGTPKEIVDLLAREVRLALKETKTLEQLDGFGVDPIGSTPEEFKATIAADLVLWREAVKDANVSL